MSYYPILLGPGCEGITTVFNFPPNNWEEAAQDMRYLNVSCAEGDRWLNGCLGKIEHGAAISIKHSDLNSFFYNACPETTFFLTLSDEPAQQATDLLPVSCVPKTTFPAWRASISLVAPTGARTSYQGEIDPFPSPGSLLTFGYFLQSSSNIRNFLLFINLEKSPKYRRGFLEVRDSKRPSILFATHEIMNNKINVISLDDNGFNTESLPVLVCKEMAGIPLYFSCLHDLSALSLEHTHPPASSVIHGDRSQAQKIMKSIWFSKIGSK